MNSGRRERERNVKKLSKKRVEAAIVLLLLGIVLFRLRDYLWEGVREIAEIPTSGKIGIFLASTGYMVMEGKAVSRLAEAFHMRMRVRNGVACAYYCGFARVATFGGGAGVAEIYYLSGTGLEPAYAFDISLIQYLCQKVAATLAGAVSLVLLFPSVEDAVGDYNIYFVCGVGIAVAIIAAILLVLLSQKTAELLFRAFDWIAGKKEAWAEKTDTWKEQVTLAQKSVRAMLHKKGRLAEIFGWSIAKYLFWFSIPFLLYGEGDPAFLFQSVGMMAIATAMASVIPVPGGYGALEFMQIILFRPLLGRARTVSMVILYRVAATILPAFIGGVVAILRRRIRKTADQTSEGGLQ